MIKLLTKAVPHWDRHTRLVWKYGSVRKIWNATRAYWAYLRGRSTVSTWPAFLKVEISRYCTVHCRFCDIVAVKDEVYYPLDDYKSLIDIIKPYVFEASLYNIGEPLEHPEAVEFIRYARQNRIGTTISTSLSLRRSEAFWEDLVRSGLDYMIVAIDGVTEEVYRKYRTKGKLDVVMENLKTILKYRKKHKTDLFIEWQMLDFAWNRCEQEEAEKLAMELGCDKFRLIKEEVLPRLENDKVNQIREKGCVFPYLVFLVDAYKKAKACCIIHHEDMTVGDFGKQTFIEIWNGKPIQCIRDREKIKKRPGCRTCRE